MRRKMKNSKNINEKNSIQYLLEFAKPCKKLLISSVFLAVLGAAAGIIPYLAVSKAIIQICAGEYSMRGILLMALIALLGYLGQLYLSTFSTIFLYLC